VLKVKAFIFLIVPVLAGCNPPLPLSGTMPELRPPAQQSLAEKMIPPLYCKPPGCAGPAARRVAYVTEIKPAKPAAPAPAAKPAPPAPSPGGPRLSALIARDELEKLSRDRLVFNAPEQMNAGVHERVEAHVPDNLAEDFAGKLKELGLSASNDIAAGSSMRVRLAGDGFDITPLGDDEKPLNAEGSAWVWDVMPVRSGAQALLLTVSIKVKIPGGGDERKELTVFTKPTTVVPSSLYSTVRLLRARWSWFLGGFTTLALAVWVVRRRRA
jgi:hypothetical protein